MFKLVNMLSIHLCTFNYRNRNFIKVIEKMIASASSQQTLPPTISTLYNHVNVSVSFESLKTPCWEEHPPEA